MRTSLYQPKRRKAPFYLESFFFSFLLLFIHLEFGISIPASTNLKVNVNRTHELTGKH